MHFYMIYSYTHQSLSLYSCMPVTLFQVIQLVFSAYLARWIVQQVHIRELEEEVKLLKNLSHANIVVSEMLLSLQEISIL